MSQANVSPEVRRLLDTAGEDYLRAVEYIAQNRDREVQAFTEGALTNEELHAIRGKIAALNLCLAILGWSEVQEQLKRY